MVSFLDIDIQSATKKQNEGNRSNNRLNNWRGSRSGCCRDRSAMGEMSKIPSLSQCYKKTSPGEEGHN